MVLTEKEISFRSSLYYSEKFELKFGEKVWRRKKQNLSVKNVGMNLQNGWGNVRVVTIGIQWLKNESCQRALNGEVLLQL